LQKVCTVIGLHQWSATWGRDPRGVVNHFWGGRELFYAHSCIALPLFEV